MLWEDFLQMKYHHQSIFQKVILLLFSLVWGPHLVVCRSWSWLCILHSPVSLLVNSGNNMGCHGLNLRLTLHKTHDSVTWSHVMQYFTAHIVSSCYRFQLILNLVWIFWKLDPLSMDILWTFSTRHVLNSGIIYWLRETRVSPCLLSLVCDKQLQG